MALFIANASHNLDADSLTKITAGFNEAAKGMQGLLDMSTIDVVCIDDAYQVIPETGVSGFALNRNLVYLYVDAGSDFDKDEIFTTLMHEFSHVMRYAGPGYGKTLFDSMIFEGIGVAIEEEVSGGKGSFLSRYIAKKDNAELLNEVCLHFDDQHFDHFHWFIQESSDLPRWTGYRVGYYIVSEFMKRMNKKASELVMESPEVFRKFVDETLLGRKTHSNTTEK